jgi:hypothetical protein
VAACASSRASTAASRKPRFRPCPATFKFQGFNLAISHLAPCDSGHMALL